MAQLHAERLQRLAMRALIRHAGPGADSAAVAAAALDAYDELARAATALIGPRGVDALMGRAVHLAAREHAWLRTDNGSTRSQDDPFAPVVRLLERQEPAAAAWGAAGLLAAFARLLTGFIGDGLTLRLLRAAWPADFVDVDEQEAETL